MNQAKMFDPCALASSYFEAAGAVTATLSAFPFRNALTQVVLFKIAKCTENDATATAAIISGTPTEGLTTNHIFP